MAFKDWFTTSDPVKEYQEILGQVTAATPAAAVPLDPDEVASKATGATARSKVIEHVAKHSTFNTMTAGSVLDAIREQVADKTGKDKDDPAVLKEAARKTAHAANAASGHRAPHVSFSKPQMLASGWRVVFAVLTTVGWFVVLNDLWKVANKHHPSSAAVSSLGTVFFLLLMTTVIFVMGYGKVDISSGFGSIGGSSGGGGRGPRQRQPRRHPHHPHHPHHPSD